MCWNQCAALCRYRHIQEMDEKTQTKVAEDRLIAQCLQGQAPPEEKLEHLR
jgi:hypothetical protein